MEVIQIRRAAAKTSTSKFSKMIECVCDDGRIRGQMEYGGARRTMRWAGRLVQVQNFERVQEDDAPVVPFVDWALNAPMTIEDTYFMLELGLPATKNDKGDKIIGGAQPLKWLATSMRSMIIADPGNRLVGGDFSNIEGRVNAWLAGETWKLEAFAAFDNKTGPDLYKVTAAGILHIEVDAVSKRQRQSHGKIPELALGFQGGVGAFITMAATYYIEASELFDVVYATTPHDKWQKVYQTYKYARDKHDLPQEHWTAVKLIVNGWREKHPAIVSAWWELQDAAIDAVENPGSPFYCYNGKVCYICIDGWLMCYLPSGRPIPYAGAHVVGETVEQVYLPHDRRWVDVSNFDVLEVDLFKELGYEFRRRHRKRVCFWGQDGVTKKWVRMSLYGGLQCENIVQATARELLAKAIVRVHRAGYPIVLHAHDEIVAECPYGWGSPAELASLMAIKPQWRCNINDLPVAVSPWEDERYVK